MCPLRLERLLTLALLGLPMALRLSMARQAVTLLKQRYPLAGCGITQEDGTTRVIAVGRN